jgi:hypothetical protein
MTAKFTAKDVLRAWPTPEPAGEAPYSGDHYCLMGAVARVLGRPENTFPGFEAGAEMLREANPALNPDDALDYVDYIVDAADAGDIVEATRILDEALEKSYATT